MKNKTRVLIVDDSAFMRKALTRMLSSDHTIQVIDTAANGEEGYLKARDLHPDVVTLDVKMPEMDGLTALKKIMAECPVPVLMLSSLTSEGGEITLRALDLGAVDFIDKSAAHTSMDILSIAGELISKVKALASVDAQKMVQSITQPGPKAAGQQMPPSPVKGRMDVVAIGSSTGGPPALQSIIAGLPASLPASVLVVQHMPKGFTASLAQRLNNLSDMTVSEAEDGDVVLPGRCLIAPSGLHMTLFRDGGDLLVRLSLEPEGLLHRPSVDVLMESLAKTVGRKALGIILTGMGADGAQGIKALHDAGGKTIAQDENSCVVYGMPKVAVEMGGVDVSLPLEGIKSAILLEVGTG